MTADGITGKRRRAERAGRSSETWAALLLRLKGYRILGRRVRTMPARSILSRARRAASSASSK
ncbi:MAG: hypothetical protein WDM81_00125 [Rhizomicrobium sp.]